jgi:hypothetical protein
MPGAQKQKIRRHLQQRQLFSLRRITAVSVRASATQLSVTVRLGKRGRKTACYSDQIDHRNDPTRSRHHESLSSIGALAKWPGLPAPGWVWKALVVLSYGCSLPWISMRSLGASRPWPSQPAVHLFQLSLVHGMTGNHRKSRISVLHVACLRRGGGVVGGHDDGATLR